jgi:hypothetical protein
MRANRSHAKVVPLTTPAANAPTINHDLLDEARKEAFILLLALDGVLHGSGAYMHAEKDVEDAALPGLAAGLSVKLARIGRQAAGEEA